MKMGQWVEVEIYVSSPSLTIETHRFEDGTSRTILHDTSPTGTVPEHLITWRGEPSSTTSHAPELHTDTGITLLDGYEWYDWS